MAEEISDLHDVRNIGIMAHIDAGKTTTTERILFYTGKNYKIGETHDGASTMDFMAQEQERWYHHPVPLLPPAFWAVSPRHQGQVPDQHHRYPRPVDFGRGGALLRVLDGAVAVFDGRKAWSRQSETVWRQAGKCWRSRICFINKMDKLGANYNYSVDTIGEAGCYSDH